METAIPQQFKEMLRGLPGVDAEALIASLDEPASVSVRVNRRKMNISEASADFNEAGCAVKGAVEWCESGLRLESRPSFTLNPLLHCGAFYVQDASSMIYEQIIGRIIAEDETLKAGASLLDFCAAPGGKTTASINALSDGSVVIANEYDARRCAVLRENLEKWGYPHTIVTNSDAKSYSRVGGVFDIVTVDAPCSGEGMMRKEEVARRQWSARLVEQCASLQRDILRDVAVCVKPGGWLVYSTCTFNPEEDERNAAYIRDELGFEPVRLPLDGVSDAGREIEGSVPALRFMQHLTEGEGLFVAVFRKPADGLPAATHEFKGKNNKKDRRGQKSGKAGKGSKSQNAWSAPGWLKENMILTESGDVVYALPDVAAPLLDSLKSAGIYVRMAGMPACRIKGREMIPDARVALTALLKPDAFASVELSREDALRYLRREAIVLDSSVPQGFVIVKYRGKALGMVKNLGNRANNLYPKEWKILMQM